MADLANVPHLGKALSDADRLAAMDPLAKLAEVVAQIEGATLEPTDDALIHPLGADSIQIGPDDGALRIEADHVIHSATIWISDAGAEIYPDEMRALRSWLGDVLDEWDLADAYPMGRLSDD